MNPKAPMHGPWPKAQHPAELTPAEREQVLTVLNSPEYADLAAQVWAVSWTPGATTARNERCTGSWPQAP